MKKEEKKPETKDKEAQKKTEKEEIAYLTEQLQRLQAEFINYKNRIEKEKAGFADYNTAEFVLKLLPILDNFEIALNSCDKNNPVSKGMEMIYAQLLDLLTKEGLRRIEALNKPFDAELHEAVLSEKSDKPENTVIEELQRGYIFKEKVIRHTKVKVAKK